jgi:cell division protein FtsW (lipid II flippase)
MRRKALPPFIPKRRAELLALAGAGALTFTGFLLIAQGRLLAGKTAVALFPFYFAETMTGQAVLAAAFVIAGFFILHRLLCFAVPERNPALFPLAAMLAAIGLMLLFRLGPDIAALRHKPGFTLLFWNQFRSFLVSLGVFGASLFVFTPKRLNELTRKRYLYALASIIFIAITAIFGTELHGRRLSLNLGIMNFQTVELVKLLALFFMVGYFRYEGRFLEQGRGRFNLPRGRYLLPYLFMWALVLLPIFFQRDLGPTMLIFSLFLVIFYLGTGSAMSVLSGLVLLTLAGAGAYFIGIPSMVRTRVDMWVDPFHHSQNISESLWAAASGGWFGKGFALGLAHRIPVVQSDFNFSVIAEEWGLIGVTAVLVTFAGLVGICLQVAQRQEKPWLQLLAAGLGALWMLQTLVIMSGNMALLPLTGITLPFISFGGSSLLMNFVMLALAIRLSANRTERNTDIQDRTTVVS